MLPAKTTADMRASLLVEKTGFTHLVRAAPPHSAFTCSSQYAAQPCVNEPTISNADGVGGWEGGLEKLGKKKKLQSDLTFTRVTTAAARIQTVN